MNEKDQEAGIPLKVADAEAKEKLAKLNDKLKSLEEK